jgi:Lon protease-like protein
MSKNKMLPILTLDLFLLPGGITRIRIFEPRYLKMVGLASDGFLLRSQLENKQFNNRASWVDIIDFDQGDDGILVIVVKCKSIVNILSEEQGADHLQFAQMQEILHWSQTKGDTEFTDLSSSLTTLLKNNELLDMLYHDKLTENPYWVVARWLELLPLPITVKNNFLSEQGYLDAKKLVNSIVQQ